MEQDENKQKTNCNKFLDEFIPNTKTFCVMPWMHLATNTQGQYKLCCKAQLPIPSNKQSMCYKLNFYDTS